MEKKENDKTKLVIVLKWIDRIICDVFLGIFGILILLGIYYLIHMMKTPPPDIDDLTTLFAILLPIAIFVFSGIIAGLVYHGKVSIKEIQNNIK